MKLRQKVEKAAAQWLARHDRGMSAAEVGQFVAWLEAEALHARVYAEMESSWRLLDETAEPAVRAVLDPELEALPARPRRVGARLPAWLAAAAALTVISAASWRWFQSGRIFAESAATAVGITRIIDLPDGSKIELNTDSSVEVRFAAAERSVKLLRGEAHFSVAKNPARPFIVSANTVSVRAIGTAFDVRLRADAVDVVVTEGKVRIDGAGPGEALPETGSPGAKIHLVPVLLAGQRTSVQLAGQDSLPKAQPVVTMQSQEVDQRLAWRERQLKFAATSLAEIVGEFNRYNRVKFVIADPTLAGRVFGGSFRADDPNTLVRLLTSTFGVVAERRGDEIVLRGHALVPAETSGQFSDRRH